MPPSKMRPLPTIPGQRSSQPKGIATSKSLPNPTTEKLSLSKASDEVPSLPYAPMVHPPQAPLEYSSSLDLSTSSEDPPSTTTSSRSSPHAVSPTPTTPDVIGRCFRFLLLGAPSVGRSSLMGRLCADQRLDGVVIRSEHDEVTPLIGISGHVVQVFSPRIRTSLVKAMDDHFLHAKFEGASVAIVVYDSTDRATFKDACAWADLESNPLRRDGIPLVVVGNKVDIDDDRDVDFDKVRTWTGKRNLGFIEVSALSGQNVRELLCHSLQKALAIAPDMPPVRPLIPRIPAIPTLSLIASYLSAKDRVQKVSLMVERVSFPGELWFPFGRENENKIDEVLRDMRQADVVIEEGNLKGVSLSALIDTAVRDSTSHIADIRVLFASTRVIGKDCGELLKLFVDKFRSSSDNSERQQCLRVFKVWVDEFREETRTKDIDHYLVAFLRGLLTFQPEISDVVHEILKVIDPRRLKSTRRLLSLASATPSGRTLRLPHFDPAALSHEDTNSASPPQSPLSSPPRSPPPSLPSSKSSSPAVSPITSPRSDSSSPSRPVLAHSRQVSLNIAISPRSAAGSGSTSPVSTPRGASKMGHPLLDFINIELAQQIAEIDREMFSKVTLIELTSLKWAKPDEAHPHPVCEITTRFNALSNWVATVIVSTESLKTRIKIVKKFWKVAKCLRELGDFHSLMAFVAGLVRGPCQRLKRTMEAISSHRVYSAIQTELSALCDAKSRFANLRAAMAAHDGPYLPYLGLSLSDLVITDEGNPNRVDSLINWGKCVLLYNKATNVVKAIKDFPPSEIVPEIRVLLLDLKIIDDDSLYDIADFMENKRRSRTTSFSTLPMPDSLRTYSKSMGASESSSVVSPRNASPRTSSSRASPRNQHIHASNPPSLSSRSVSSFARSRAQSSGSMTMHKTSSGPLTSSDPSVCHKVSSTSSPVPLPRTVPMEVVHETHESKDKKNKNHSRLFSSTH